MLQINGKTFMNLQEAVQWLLDNNALPFQANVNYVANTEIAKSAIINPSPVSIKVGSLVLFADSKVGTVIGTTSNSFMVGSDYTDIKDALNYISDVQVNSSQHLITIFSDGSTKDAGLIKEIYNFSIDASQHLIANFNDGTTQDLGAIFSGNITISGDLTVSGSINGEPNPSVKPIYWHGLELSHSTLKNYMNAHILGNDNSAINTLAKLEAWFAPLPTYTRLGVNGSVKVSTSWYSAFQILKMPSGYDVFYVEPTSSGFGRLSVASLSDLFDAIDDSINKIN